MDEYGMTCLQAAPKIKLLPDTQKRQPYPLSWDEQTALFKELPDHLAQTTHYSAAELTKLIEAAENVCDRGVSTTVQD